jgi:hypothetical protein
MSIRKNGGGINHKWIPSVHGKTQKNKDDFIKILEKKDVEWCNGISQRIFHEKYLEGNLKADAQAKRIEFEIKELYIN